MIEVHAEILAVLATFLLGQLAAALAWARNTDLRVRGLEVQVAAMTSAHAETKGDVKILLVGQATTNATLEDLRRMQDETIKSLREIREVREHK